MTILRLYFEEDSMRRALVRSLQTRGVDVVTASEAGMRERTDEEQLVYATAQGRVLYSFNVGHFSRLHTDYLSGGKRHAGMILAPQQRYSVGEQMRRLLTRAERGQRVRSCCQTLHWASQVTFTLSSLARVLRLSFFERGCKTLTQGHYSLSLLRMLHFSRRFPGGSYAQRPTPNGPLLDLCGLRGQEPVRC